MTWGMVAVAGASLVAGKMASGGAKKGAKATQEGGQAAIAEQQRQFDLTRADQAPWMQAGTGALTQMQALNGGDFSKFYQTPDYTFARDQGLQSLERGAAARGGMYSGGADADRMKFASGLASQNYNQFYNRLQSMAGQGQTTASGLGAMGMGMANSIGNIHGGMADARASAYQQKGAIGGQMAGVLGGAFNNYMQNRNASQWGGGMGGGGSGGSGMYYNAPSTASGANWTNAYGYKGP